MGNYSNLRDIAIFPRIRNRFVAFLNYLYPCSYALLLNIIKGMFSITVTGKQ